MNNSKIEDIRQLMTSKVRMKYEIEQSEEKIKHNISIIENVKNLNEKYPFLYWILKRRLEYIYDFIYYSKDKVVSKRGCDKKGNYYFFASCRYLEKQFGGKYNTWSRNISIFCTLGLLKKFSAEEVAEGRFGNKLVLKNLRKFRKKQQSNGKKVRDINFYIVPFYDDIVLSHANEIARILKENNFKTNSFSKIYLIKVFGQKFANTIYPDDRFITDYSNYVTNEIQKYILEDIEINGYTTKTRVIENVDINFSQLKSWEYGYNKRNRKAIVQKEFERSITEILKLNNLIYRKANKELKWKFKLKSYITIIYRIV